MDVGSSEDVVLSGSGLPELEVVDVVEREGKLVIGVCIGGVET